MSLVCFSSDETRDKLWREALPIDRVFLVFAATCTFSDAVVNTLTQYQS